MNKKHCDSNASYGAKYCKKCTLANIHVNIPSYQVKEGDVVGVREKSKTLNIIQGIQTDKQSVYEWLSWNKDEFHGTYLSIPERIQIPENIKEQLIVELYSK